MLAAEIALQRGLASSTAGGTHHAFPSFGSGFCLLNDLAVAAKYASSSLKRKVLIVDLDVHQVSQRSACSIQRCFHENVRRFNPTGRWHRFHFQRGAAGVYFLSALWEKLPPP